jgi:hypothetical protein
MTTSSKFYNTHKDLLDKYGVVELFKYDIVMYDDCVNGPKRTNKVNHVTFDFTEKDVVNVSWMFTDLLLLNLVAEEFDTGCWLPEEPLYMEFNGTKYTQFSDGLIIDMLENRDLKNVRYVCTHDVWNGKSIWLRYIQVAGQYNDCVEESVRDLK